MSRAGDDVWTGNLFLETWSNRNLEDGDAHAELGSNPGWLVTSRADLLLCYFLDSDDLVTVPFLRLKRWAFGSGPQGGIYAWPEAQQRRYGQRNDTWSRCVPVSFLEANVGARRTKVRQAALPLMTNSRPRTWWRRADRKVSASARGQLLVCAPIASAEHPLVRT